MAAVESIAPTMDAARSVSAFDVDVVRAEFPILSTEVNGTPLVYLDSAASAQKPGAVIDALTTCLRAEYANVHRGLHYLSERATERFESAREAVRRFIGARSTTEIVFTRGATEAINLVMYSWGRTFLGAGDVVLLSEAEHHSNIVPWQMLRDEKGIDLRVVPITDDGRLDMDAFRAALDDGRVRLVAMAHMSNVLGTVYPVDDIIADAHAAGAKVLLDGCQGVVHQRLDVRAMDVDFYVFSGHKLYGPTGIGVLYAKEALLDAMPPFHGGGDMIASVSFEKSTWAELPAKFEAGTPAIAEGVALGAAIDWLEGIDRDAAFAHEHDLLAYATQQLAQIDGLRLIGTAPGKGSVVSFVMDSAHPHDIATILDGDAIAVRAGHHCAEPLMHRLGVPGTTRAAFALYNTRAEVDALVAGLHKVNRLFG